MRRYGWIYSCMIFRGTSWGSKRRAANRRREPGSAMHTELFTPQTRLRAAWLCFAAHVAANLVMLLVLIRGIPPGALEVRRAFIAAHPTVWALGWGVWMLAA